MTSNRWRVFLDTNVVIAGLLSRTGASAAILDLGEAEEILPVVSRQVLVEADRTVLAKFPQLIERYRMFIRNLAPLLVEDPSAALVREAATHIAPHDAPILAAATAARADYLITLNTKHFLTPPVRAFCPCSILTPGEFLTAFRRFWEHAA